MTRAVHQLFWVAWAAITIPIAVAKLLPWLAWLVFPVMMDPALRVAATCAEDRCTWAGVVRKRHDEWQFSSMAFQVQRPGGRWISVWPLDEEGGLTAAGVPVTGGHPDIVAPSYSREEGETPIRIPWTTNRPAAGVRGRWVVCHRLFGWRFFDPVCTTLADVPPDALLPGTVWHYPRTSNPEHAP